MKTDSGVDITADYADLLTRYYDLRKRVMDLYFSDTQVITKNEFKFVFREVFNTK